MWKKMTFCERIFRLRFEAQIAIPIPACASRKVIIVVQLFGYAFRHFRQYNSVLLVLVRVILQTKEELSWEKFL